MLQIRLLSGEEVASIPVDAPRSVRELKQRLHQLHGQPPRFRQRLLLQGASLSDDVKLDSPMDLDLVLLPFADASQAQVKELADAAEGGAAEEARTPQLSQAR